MDNFPFMKFHIRPRVRKRKTCSCSEIPTSTISSSGPNNKRRRVQNVNTVLSTLKSEPMAEQTAVTNLVSKSLALPNVFPYEIEEIIEDTVFESEGHTTRRIKQRACRTVQGLESVHTFIKEGTYTITSTKLDNVGEKLGQYQTKPDNFKSLTPTSSKVARKLVSKMEKIPSSATKHHGSHSKRVTYHAPWESLDSEDNDFDHNHYRGKRRVSENGDSDSGSRDSSFDDDHFNWKGRVSESGDSDSGSRDSSFDDNHFNWKGCVSESGDSDSGSRDSSFDDDHFNWKGRVSESDDSDSGSRDSNFDDDHFNWKGRVSESGDSDSGSRDSIFDDNHYDWSGRVSDSNNNSDSGSFHDNRNRCASQLGGKNKKKKERKCTCSFLPCPSVERPVPKLCPIEIEKLQAAFLTNSTDKTEYEILQDVSICNQGCSPCVYLYSNELLTICNRQQYNLRVDRTFNLGACLVTAFVFRNSNLIYNNSHNTGRKYGPLMTGPVMLHFDKDPETYIRFFETIHEKASIAKKPLSEGEMGDMRGVKTKDHVITRSMRKVFGSNMSLTSTHHVPIHLKNELRLHVSCHSPVSDAVKAVYERLTLERIKMKVAILYGVGKSYYWSLNPRAERYLKKWKLSSITEKLQALDRLGLKAVKNRAD